MKGTVNTNLDWSSLVWVDRPSTRKGRNKEMKGTTISKGKGVNLALTKGMTISEEKGGGWAIPDGKGKGIEGGGDTDGEGLEGSLSLSILVSLGISHLSRSSLLVLGE